MTRPRSGWWVELRRSLLRVGSPSKRMATHIATPPYMPQLQLPVSAQRGQSLGENPVPVVPLVFAFCPLSNEKPHEVSRKYLGRVLHHHLAACSAALCLSLFNLVLSSPHELAQMGHARLRPFVASERALFNLA
eukprot:CAMPEP_0205905494 /NCGR_PEP_ID=MMETSP1325-20131115/1384_1 /ASSEMBLY_ACC=CAM_ASM_000708 /TAXON_ID=236786 /ORGANISM="Florenciella sp., Strain RCC1007" /LENGTH=133 /DNA_ID=CAMNT_0053271405 /DNA_START=186 /DNA_END=583 /DNA_ORIENTATION=-